MKIKTFTLLCLLLASLAGYAQVHLVPSATYPTIASAITSASNGDTIQIAAITLTEKNITVNKSLTFIGAGQNSTIIQAHASPGMANGRIFNVTSGVSVRFEKMTLRHGSSDFDGAGIRFNSCHFSLEEVTFKDNWLSSNFASVNGGAINVTLPNSSPNCEIRKCIFEGNQAGEPDSIKENRWGSYKLSR